MNPFTPEQEKRFMRVAARATRRLPSDIQQEIFAEAYIKARETHGEFDPKRGEGHVDSRIDNWFYGKVLNAKKQIRRQRMPLGASEALNELVSADDPAAEAERNEALDQRTPDELAILAALGDGASVRQAARLCKATVNRVKQLKRLARKGLNVVGCRLQAAQRREPTAASDDDMREPAPIDHEIEKLLRRPATEKADCPVCWRCSWFEGLLPIQYKARELADPEVAEAILRVELRKIDIANGTEPREAPDDVAPIHRQYKRLDFLFPYYSQEQVA